jgi:uncharacterized membrane protein YadS
VFPAIGHWLHLSQENLVCGVLLRFTTPVQLFAAANKYGPQALQIATTVKLARALWIIPVALITAIFKNKSTKIKIPYFIALFILAMILNTYLPQTAGCSLFSFFSKNRTYCNIVLIGAGLNATVLKSVGIKPLLQEFCFGHALPLIFNSILFSIRVNFLLLQETAVGYNHK